MNNNKAFTLLEVMISIAISTFIVLAMTQIYRNVTNFLGMSQETISIDKKLLLLFDQMERDLSTAFIPKLHEEILPKKDNEKNKQNDKTLSAKPVVEKEKKEEITNYFFAKVYEGESERSQGKRFDLSRNINFITTNSFQVYEQRRPRIVRVMYELVKDKNKSLPDKSVYSIYRKETLDLSNYSFKEQQEFLKSDSDKEKREYIRKILVAQNVKSLFIEFITKKKEQNEKVSLDEEVSSFVWGDNEKTKDVVPEKVQIYVSFWDDKLERSYSFNCMIPIFSYPTTNEDLEDKKVEDKKEDKKPQDSKALTTQLKDATNMIPKNPPVVRKVGR